MVAAVAGVVFASGLAAQTTAPLREHAQGAVSYVTGGVGSDEAQAMRAAAADYPLTLELAATGSGPRDEYISGAEVAIRDSRGGSVLDTLTDGPFLLVRLPAGTYIVDVDWHGVHKTKSVEVGASRREHVMLEFPASVE
jgi:hypothetical protein